MNVLDVARASAASFEMERCLHMVRTRERCARLDFARPLHSSLTRDPLVSEIRIAALVFILFLVVTIVALAHLAAPGS